MKHVDEDMDAFGWKTDILTESRYPFGLCLLLLKVAETRMKVSKTQMKVAETLNPKVLQSSESRPA